MDVVLINPGGITSWQGDVASLKSQYMFPYSIIYLQNYLLKQGIDAMAFDLYETKPDAVVSHCAPLARPLIGVTSQSYTRYEAIDVIRRVKQANPKAVALVGGKHFSFCAEETLTRVPEIDIVARGEGEVTLHELVQALDGERDLATVDGIVYRDGHDIRVNPDRRPQRDIELFALDYEKLPTDSFRRGVFLRNFENEGILSLPIHLGRGCPRKCIFCSFGLTAYRVRKAQQVLDEIAYLKQKFANPYFTFCDPSFCERKDFVREFCGQLIQENFNIKWHCEARVDAPLDLLELMAKAGCISLDFAIESGSERVLKTMRKNINMPQAMEFARHCKEFGIRTLVFFMVSLPDEREEDALQTLAVAEKLAEYTKYMDINPTCILPGTELERIARERNSLPEDFSWYDARFHTPYPDLGYDNLPLYLENLSVDFIRDIQGRFKRLKYSQYATPADFARMVKKGVRRAFSQPFSSTVKDAKEMARRVSAKLSYSLSSKKKKS